MTTDRATSGPTTERATEPMLARLRRTRHQHESTVRWIQLLTPVLLVVFVVAAGVATPHPGLTGVRLIVSLGVLAFIVGVFGRNATEPRMGGAHLIFVAILSVGAIALLVVQPTGPGAEAVLLAVLCFARLLPARAGTPTLVVAFVLLELIAWLTNRGGLAVLAVMAAFYGMIYLAFRLRQANRQAEELLEDLRESQAAQARAAGLAERQRLAREMHDVLAHSLSGLVLQLEGARLLATDNPTDPRLPEVIDRAHRLGRTGLEEARRAIGMLRDDELPGPERLTALAEDFRADHGIPVESSVSGQAYALGSEVRLALYRVAQEALTNIARHARAERVEVRLAYEIDRVRLTVEDIAPPPDSDSPDSDPTDSEPTATPEPLEPAESPGGGYGLTGMRERAELLGGTLTAGPTDTGFKVDLEVPR